MGLSPYSAWMIALPLALWCSWPLHEGLLRSWRQRRANADMIASVSILAAFFYTTAVEFRPEWLPASLRIPMFSVLASVAVLTLTGRWLEGVLTERSEESLWRLTRRIPSTARIIESGGPEGGRPIPTGELKPGDRIKIRSGEPIPLDAEIISGSSSVDEAFWTGSMEPAEKAPGSVVMGGSINKGNDLIASVLRAREEIVLSRLVRSVQSGSEAKNSEEGLLDRAAASYAPVSVMAAVASAILWSLLGGIERLPDAMGSLFLVLATACPWPLTLAAPAALLFGLRRADRMGLRIRNPAALQTLSRPDVIVIHKTGFLTEGRPVVSEFVCFGGWTKEGLLPLALAAGRRSGHPYAQALCALGGEPAQAQAIEIEPGLGGKALVAGRRVLVGSLPWLSRHGVTLEPEVESKCLERSEPMLALSVDEVPAGVVFFNDPLRPGIEGQLKALSDLGMEIIIASGDRAAAVQAVASQVGVKRIFTEVHEGDKVKLVRELQALGRKVVMVGEGVHDAPALSRADLSIALPEKGARDSARAHFDIAAESADMVMRERSLDVLTRAIILATVIRSVVKENLKWAFFPTAALLPLAAGALRFWPGVGIRTEFLAAAAVLSSVGIFFNSMRRLKI